MAIFPQGRLIAPCISHCARWLGGSAHRPERWCDSLIAQASWCEEHSLLWTGYHGMALLCLVILSADASHWPNIIM